MTLKSFVKGWIGEAASALTQKVLLDPKIYTSIHNVTLQTGNGTTQIDHIIVSRHGIFVVETKNMDGWIFGDENGVLAIPAEQLEEVIRRAENVEKTEREIINAVREGTSLDEARQTLGYHVPWEAKA